MTSVGSISNSLMYNSVQSKKHANNPSFQADKQKNTTPKGVKCAIGLGLTSLAAGGIYLVTKGKIGKSLMNKVQNKVKMKAFEKINKELEHGKIFTMYEVRNSKILSSKFEPLIKETSPVSEYLRHRCGNKHVISDCILKKPASFRGETPTYFYSDPCRAVTTKDNKGVLETHIFDRNGLVFKHERTAGKSRSETYFSSPGRGESNRLETLTKDGFEMEYTRSKDSQVLKTNGDYIRYEHIGSSTLRAFNNMVNRIMDMHLRSKK